MSARMQGSWAAIAIAAVVLSACGGSSKSSPSDDDASGGGEQPPPTVSVSEYLQGIPDWEEFSPALPQVPSTRVGDPITSEETIDNVAIEDPETGAIIGYRSEQYACTSTTFTMADTPEKIVMFSPDRELLWPGALIQGKSHRDGIGSLLPLTISERTPIRVSIPSLATAYNYTQVDSPNLAEVNQAIGSMIYDATTSDLVTPSTIQFVMEDYSSEESFALKARMSGRYLGFRASASASVDRAANERTVMVYFFEKMFEVVVEPPQSPDAFFSEAFTSEKLEEQVAMGRIGPDNPPVYLSNVVYGRMMAFAFTSTASTSEIKAAMNAAYKGISGSFEANVTAEHRKVLAEGRIAVTSLGGESSATVAMIASGDWREYFTEVAPLTSAYPISYTFRNLGDGSIAKVSESTEYTIKECQLDSSAFSGFVLESFEDGLGEWQAQMPPVELAWGAPTTPQSIFYGYLQGRHTNRLQTGDTFMYDVGYLLAPPHFIGEKQDFYRGELTFWFKPDEYIRSEDTGRYCYYPFPFMPWYEVCVDELVEQQMPLDEDYLVFAYDDVTTFDQVVLRGGTEPYAVLTLTYNPAEVDVPREWRKHTVALTNDLVSGACDPSISTQGCWLVEDRVATEEEIRFVLENVTDMRLRASYPVHRTLCAEELPPGADPASCEEWVQVPFGYVGGYFDEVKLGAN